VQNGDTPAAFSVFRTDDGVALGGEIDIAAVDAFRAEFSEVTDASRPVAIDLRDVSFIDSSGIEALVAARRDAERAGGSVVLRAPSAAVVRVLEVTGLDDVFRIERTATDDL
jgi:anti-anti-sigma factor